MAEISLELRNIKKSFTSEETVLNNIDLTIEKGEFITLLGSSGCGKTTTLRIIAGLEQPDEGTFSPFGAAGRKGASASRPAYGRGGKLPVAAAQSLADPHGGAESAGTEDLRNAGFLHPLGASDQDPDRGDAAFAAIG